MWNNRIFKHKYSDIYPDSARTAYPIEFVFGIHETFYDSEGNVTSRTKESLYGYFESVEEIEGTFALIFRDLERFKGKVLDDSVFKTKGRKVKREKPCGKSFNSAAELFADLNDKPAPHKHFSQKIREATILEQSGRLIQLAYVDEVIKGMDRVEISVALKNKYKKKGAK